jgi:putative ABC transport system permease protein
MSLWNWLFHRHRREEELDEEVQAHLRMAAQERMAQGETAEQARASAVREFGNVTLVKEVTRDMWGFRWLETLLQDLRYGLRQLKRSPGFTAVAVITLALGIGANTAIFSAVNALLLNPYPFPEPDRIVSVEARHVSGKNHNTGYRDFLDWRDQNSVFEEIAILPEVITYTLTGQGDPQHITGGLTTVAFLRVLGIQPLLGRFFTAEEDKLDAPRVAVLSYAAWQGRFGGSEGVLGRTMTLDGKPFTIIGVLPARFAFPGIKTCEFFASVQESPAQDRYQHQYGVMARLKPGVTVEQAQADMTTIARRLEQEYPKTNTGWGVSVRPIRKALAEQLNKPATILFLAVAFVLLLACVNLAGLQLARASGKAREIAVRSSLGASRGRIIRQMLTESVVLALGGGSFGLIVAVWLMAVLRGVAPQNFALDSALRMDTRVLTFTLGVSLLTAVAFGLVPAWHGSRTDLNRALKGDVNSWRGARSRNRLMSWLVASEVGLSLVLLVGAGLLVKDFLFLLHVNTGLRIDHVLTFEVDPPYSKYRSAGGVRGVYQELLDRLRVTPGVSVAAAVDTLPMDEKGYGGGFEIESRPKAADWVATLVQYNGCDPGFFRTMGIPLLQGRDFDEWDTPASRPVAIINDALARQFFPDEDPIGHRFKDEYGGQWRTIVGVMGSYKDQRPMNPPRPMVFRPLAQTSYGRQWVVVRTSRDPVKLAAAARAAVRAIDRDIPVSKLRTMSQVVADSLSEPRLIILFLTGFAGFALGLAAIGIYGIVMYSVTQRIHEMGIRVALGASPGDLLRMVLSKGALLAAAGVGLGVPVALALSRMMVTLLYGISPHDVTVFVGAPLVLVLVALLASYVPARRATKADPMVALRYE